MTTRLLSFLRSEAVDLRRWPRGPITVTAESVTAELDLAGGVTLRRVGTGEWVGWASWVLAMGGLVLPEDFDHGAVTSDELDRVEGVLHEATRVPAVRLACANRLDVAADLLESCENPKRAGELLLEAFRGAWTPGGMTVRVEDERVRVAGVTSPYGLDWV